MSKIRESRLLTIQEKIFTLKNIRELGKVILEEYQANASKSKLVTISYSVTCADDSSFQSEDISMFDEDSIINSKRVLSINMTYENYLGPGMHDSIKVYISHGNREAFNTITVNGSNSLWVNGIIGKLKGVIDAVPPQNLIIKKHRRSIKSIFAFGLGLICMNVLLLIVSLVDVPKMESKEAWEVLLDKIVVRFPFMRYALKYATAWLTGYVFGFFLIYKLDDSIAGLWPSVEIQIGPEHTFSEKRQRSLLLKIFVFGVLPILITIISDIIKNLL